MNIKIKKVEYKYREVEDFIYRKVEGKNKKRIKIETLRKIYKGCE